MTKLFITDPKKLLLAVAQVIEDHPERHTKYRLARKANGRSVRVESKAAVCFCASGMMIRLVAEGTTTSDTAYAAKAIFERKIGFSLSRGNDYSTRKSLISKMRKAAS
jgi:hypothetical protein